MRGFAVSSPSLVAASTRTPRSTPTARPVVGSGAAARSHSNTAYHRPFFSTMNARTPKVAPIWYASESRYRGATNSVCRPS
jgi:hypothetical protein